MSFDFKHIADTLRAAIRASKFYAPLRRARFKRSALKNAAGADWTVLLDRFSNDWIKARETASGPRVLVATNLGLHSAACAIDSLLAVALTWRGARVDVAFCDAALPACQMAQHDVVPSISRFAQNGPQTDLCIACQAAGHAVFVPLELPLKRLSQFANRMSDDQVSAPDSNLSESARENAYAGALRFFGAMHLPETRIADKVHNRYRGAAIRSENAARTMLDAGSYDVVVAHHGIYTPQGAFANAAREKGVRLVTWHAAYRKGRFIFSEGDTYHRSMITEPADQWNDRALSDEEDRALDQYLLSRETGDQDWIRFQRTDPHSPTALAARLGINFDKPVFALLGSVGWDARLHFPNSAYSDMSSWALDTIEWFKAHPHLHLVIRCHPGEVVGSPPATDRLDQIIQDAYPALPDNVTLIPSNDDLNTYSLVQMSRAALAYNTKMSIEIAARGKPVVVAGDAWVRGKGISEDASSAEEYLKILDRLEAIGDLDDDAKSRARRFAYHFFFRRCIELKSVDPDGSWPLLSLHPDAARLAMPGQDAGLDAICNGVLYGRAFECG